MPNEIILLSPTLLNTSRASIKVRNNWLRLKIFKYSELNIRIYRNSIVSFFKAIIQGKKKIQKPQDTFTQRKKSKIFKSRWNLEKGKKLQRPRSKAY